MRSHEERVAETKRRIAKIEREKRLRRNTITMASAVAACLALLIGASLAMPGIAANIQTGDYSGFETAASISLSPSSSPLRYWRYKLSSQVIAFTPFLRMLKCRGGSVRCLSCRDRGAVPESAGRTAFPHFPGSPMSARTGTRRRSAPRRNIG